VIQFVTGEPGMRKGLEDTFPSATLRLYTRCETTITPQVHIAPAVAVLVM
jgi:hypothetical protein